MKPHTYNPDTQAMGDCAICGQSGSALIHQEKPVVSETIDIAPHPFETSIYEGITTCGYTLDIWDENGLITRMCEREAEDPIHGQA